MLSIKGISKSFDGVLVVDNCSLKVARGSITGLIGPNGAGKTTLFNIITGFYKPDKGKVIFKGVDITNWPPYRIARLGLLRTFQITKELPQMTVWENLLIIPKITKAKAEEALDLVNLTSSKDKLAKELSGGQKKLLSLAMTIAANPSLILLDEIGAGVNPVLMKKLYSYLKEINSLGVTLFLIEHDMDLVMNLCDPIIVMSQGQVIAQGKPTKIRSNPEVVTAYLGEED